MLKTDTALHLLLAIVGLLPATQQLLTPPPLGLTTRGTVTKTVDGDTIDIELRYKIRVRLIDAWSPEINTPEGKKAKADLQKLAEGKEVILHIPTHEARSLADLLTLNRVVGTVWLKDSYESLAEWQVKHKNAATAKGVALGK